MTSNGGQGQPPATRSRAASARTTESEELKLDSIVEAVVARLVQSGLTVTPGASAAGASAASEAAAELVRPAVMKVECDEEQGEARGLLIIGDAAGPPPEHRSWYWGRVRLFLIVAHHGWAAASTADGDPEDICRRLLQLLVTEDGGAPGSLCPAPAPTGDAALPVAGDGRWEAVPENLLPVGGSPLGLVGSRRLVVGGDARVRPPMRVNGSTILLLNRGQGAVEQKLVEVVSVEEHESDLFGRRVTAAFKKKKEKKRKHRMEAAMGQLMQLYNCESDEEQLKEPV
ncbi:hypothetical protein FJT64_000480 [Amphibalanus amphitrite]|uniref:Uncharacterized protein n=1 Tax=Amphibalanus amphitrite TaxID=1232801 RepID=A0A6A4W4R8_AMPAM|nr:hypothetical protein FJT64_000480 [Amphibalanus amphitrite]